MHCLRQVRLFVQVAALRSSVQFLTVMVSRGTREFRKCQRFCCTVKWWKWLGLMSSHKKAIHVRIFIAKLSFGATPSSFPMKISITWMTTSALAKPIGYSKTADTLLSAAEDKIKAWVSRPKRKQNKNAKYFGSSLTTAKSEFRPTHKNATMIYTYVKRLLEKSIIPSVLTIVYTLMTSLWSRLKQYENEHGNDVNRRPFPV